MKNWMPAMMMIAAGGLTVTAADALLPNSEIRETAKTAIGIVLLELLAAVIADIFL